MADCKTVDEYIARAPEDRQNILRQIRQTIRAAAPEAEERISYGMPAFWQGETLICFAAAKNHIGIYPTGSGVAAFAGRLGQYSQSKGAVRIPWIQPVPYDLIADITRFRLAEAKARTVSIPSSRGGLKMTEYPLHKAFMFIEPGPVVLVTTAGVTRPNVMTLSWTMVLDFTPRLAFMTGPWNYSFDALMKTRECVIAVPTVNLSEKVVEIGSCSGRDVDKFEKFGLTAAPASEVKAPLIAQCHANLECRVVDYVQEHSIFVLDCVKAWADEGEKNPRFFHAIGDGRFVADGETFSHREIMQDKLPPGV